MAFICIIQLYPPPLPLPPYTKKLQTAAHPAHRSVLFLWWHGFDGQAFLQRFEAFLNHIFLHLLRLFSTFLVCICPGKTKKSLCASLPPPPPFHMVPYIYWPNQPKTKPAMFCKVSQNKYHEQGWQITSFMSFLTRFITENVIPILKYRKMKLNYLYQIVYCKKCLAWQL